MDRKLLPETPSIFCDPSQCQQSAGTLDDRIAAFLSDRGATSLAGPRRYGRQELAGRVAEVAGSMGMRVSRSLSDTDCDIMILDHWSELSGEPPEGIDVILGQDLCHQVPAVIRFRS